MKKLLILFLILMPLSLSVVNADTMEGEIIHIDIDNQLIITLEVEGFKAYDFDENLVWERNVNYSQNYTIDDYNNMIYFISSSTLYSIDYLNNNYTEVITYDFSNFDLKYFYHNEDKLQLFYETYNIFAYTETLSDEMYNHLWFDEYATRFYRLDIAINPNTDSLGVFYDSESFVDDLYILYFDYFLDTLPIYEKFDLSFLSDDPFFEFSGYKLKYAATEESILMAVEGKQGVKLLNYYYGSDMLGLDYLLFDEDSDGYIIDMDVNEFGYTVTYYEDDYFNYMFIDGNNVIYQYKNTNPDKIYFTSDGTLKELVLGSIPEVNTRNSFFVETSGSNINRTAVNEEFDNTFDFEVIDEDYFETTVTLEPVSIDTLTNINLLFFKYNKSIKEFNFEYDNHSILFTTTDTYIFVNYVTIAVIVFLSFAIMLVRKSQKQGEDEELTSYYRNSNNNRDFDYFD